MTSGWGSSHTRWSREAGDRHSGGGPFRAVVTVGTAGSPLPSTRLHGGMDLGDALLHDVGPRFGAVGPTDLAALFPPLAEDDEPGAFGPLEGVLGWVGPSGPGLALRLPVRGRLDPAVHAVELRLRDRGRWVRSRLRAFADRHGDLTLAGPAAPVIHAFLPWAALPPRFREGVVEAWLVEDGEPVEEGAWRIALPGHEARRLDNALTAVVLALTSVAAAPGTLGRAADPAGFAPSGAILDAVVGLFGLDAAGRAWAEEIVADALPEADRSIARRLTALVAPQALPPVLGLLRGFARGPRAAAYVARLTERIGVAPAPPPRVSPATAAHLRTLGLGPGATPAEIRAAFHRAAAAHHPDRVPEAERAEATERMKRVNAAWAALRPR